jgi:hypothetical protein
MSQVTIRQRIETGILLAIGCLILAKVYEEWFLVVLAGRHFACESCLSDNLSSAGLPVVRSGAGFSFFLYILLTLLFFLLVTPVGLFRKWIGKDSLQLKKFKQRTGYGLLINTSFNIKDEPTACTPTDAIECFGKTGMDTLVMERFLFRKSNPDKAESF